MPLAPGKNPEPTALASYLGGTLRGVSPGTLCAPRDREEDRLLLDETKRARIRELAVDFPRLWRDPKTPDRERKRMARLLLEDVTLIKGDEILVHVRFSGGATRSLTLPRPLSAWELRQLSQEVVAEIDGLLDRHTDGEVAQLLNERGVLFATAQPFDARRIQVIRRAYGLATREQRLRAQGLLTLKELAARLGLHIETVKRHRREGRLPLRCHRVDDNNRFMYEDPDALPAEDRTRSVAHSEEVQYA